MNSIKECTNYYAAQAVARQKEDIELFFDKLLLTAIEDNPITDEDFSELEHMYHPSIYDDDLLLNRISSYEFIDINIMNHNNFELYKKFKAWLLRKKK